jgi:hypothetical protein
MNFLVFWPYAFIISKNIRLPLFELIKDKAAFKVRYKVTLPGYVTFLQKAS